MRHNLLAAAMSAGLGLAGLACTGNALAADAATDAQIQELRAQIASMQERLDQLQQRTDAQSDINVAGAQSAEAAKATQDKVDALAKTVNSNQFSGKMFFDLTNIDQTSRGTTTDASGNGFDVKRFYLGVNHTFDDTWSANLTTDFQYVSSLDSAADVYVKKAYLQGKFSDAFVGRIGSADMPWIPYVENSYGFRYVENTLVDRLKFGASADWGLHAGGDLAGKRANYAVSLVNGGGYKNTSRSSKMDVEARLGFVPVDGMVVAIGGYSGTLAKDTQSVDAQHTAQRGDVLVAYAKDRVRVGGEYFRASNWTTVLSPLLDSADGYSLWGSYAFGSSGISAFARYDRANLSSDLDPSLTDRYYNFGVEFPVRKGVKLAAVYKQDKRQNESNTVDLDTKEIGVWGEVAF
jgi:hypothetical protein